MASEASNVRKEETGEEGSAPLGVLGAAPGGIPGADGGTPKEDPASNHRGNTDRLGRPLPFPWDRPGFVYLIKKPRSQYKIGWTANVKQRFTQLGGTIAGLSVVHIIPAASPQSLERFLHSAFHHCRIKGEWFRLLPEDVTDILTIVKDDCEVERLRAMSALNMESFTKYYHRGRSKKPGPKMTRLPAKIRVSEARTIRRICQSTGENIGDFLARAVREMLAKELAKKI